MTPGICECGCGQRTRLAQRTSAAKGHIKGLPQRFLNGHRIRLDSVRLNRERATPWRERVIEDARGCLVWQGCVNSKGYACITDGTGRSVLAHRQVWEAEHGPIPEGSTIDHRCQVKRCLNTAHMEVVTRGENTRRRFRPPGLEWEVAA